MFVLCKMADSSYPARALLLAPRTLPYIYISIVFPLTFYTIPSSTLKYVAIHSVCTSLPFEATIVEDRTSLASGVWQLLVCVDFAKIVEEKHSAE